MVNMFRKIAYAVKSKLASCLQFIKFVFIPRNRKFSLALLVILFIAIVVCGHYAHAAFGMQDVVNLINQIFFAACYCIGWMVMQVFSVLIAISGWNEFVTLSMVTRGWVLVRDSCNMLFVIILLVIAFGTILRVKEYEMSSLLPKVLIAAVLVNFSKLICGLIIDFAQVFMMTFVNGYAQTAGANLIIGLGLGNLLKLSQQNTQGTTTSTAIKPSDITLILFLSIIFMTITLIVSGMILVLLAIRIAYLLILTVLSPLAFGMNVLSFTKKYSGEWWKLFGNQVAIGPFMAFFLWLSLLMMSQGPAMVPQNIRDQQDALSKKSLEQPKADNMQLGSLVQFAIATVMLCASFKLAQDMGGITAKVAGKAAGLASGAAKRLTGYHSLATRAKAVQQGWKTRSQAKEKMAMAKYQRLGGRAFSAKEGVVKVGKKAVRVGWEGAKAATLIAPVTRVGMEMLKGKNAGDAVKSAWEKAKMRTTRAGGMETVMRADIKQDNKKDVEAEATKRLKAQQLMKKEEDKHRILGSGNRGERAAMAQELAAKGQLKDRKEFELALASLAGDVEGTKKFEDAVKAKQLHLAYDFENFGNEKGAKDKKKFNDEVQEGKVDFAAQQKKAYSSEAFLDASKEAMGEKKYEKEILKVSEKSDGHREIVGDTYKRKMARMANAKNPDIDVNELNMDSTDAKQGERAAALRKLVAKITLDLDEAYAERNTDGTLPPVGKRTFSDKEKAKANMENFVTNASTSQLANMSISVNAQKHVANNVRVEQMAKLATSLEAGAQNNFDGIVAYLVKNMNSDEGSKKKLADMAGNERVMGAMDPEMKKVVEGIKAEADKLAADAKEADKAEKEAAKAAKDAAKAPKSSAGTPPNENTTGTGGGYTVTYK